MSDTNEFRAKFHSESEQLTIMRSPQEVTRTVNGVMQIVKEDQIPFKFESGDLTVYSQADAEELRDHRLFGVMFIELPLPVMKVADKKAAENKSADAPPEDTGTEPQQTVEPTIIESVSSYNDAMTYFKEEYGLEHKDVNSKDKIVALAEKHVLEFPNYPLDEDE